MAPEPLKDNTPFVEVADDGVGIDKETQTKNL